MNILKKITAVILCFVLIGFSFTAYADEEKEPLKYVVLGDSISRGSGITNRDKACFGRIIADTNGYDYVNYGVDGLESSGLLSMLNRADVIKDVSEADIISISIGGNNYLNSLLSLLFGGVLIRRETALDGVLGSFYDDFCNIISTIRELNSETVIIVQTLYNPSTGLLRSLAGFAVKKLNDCFYRYESENPGVITIADVATALDGHAQCFEVIHPTAQGNVKIAEVLLDVLYDLGLGESRVPVIKTKGINSIEYAVAIILNPSKVITAVEYS